MALEYVLVKRPQLSLRDLFWLVLVAAIAVAWTVSHRRSAGEIKQLQRQGLFHYWISDSSEPSAEATARVAALESFSKLSDEQLSARLRELRDLGNANRMSEYEPCLTEMARRRLHQELQDQFDESMNREQTDDAFFDRHNLELLTALRRAQGHPDPLQVNVELWRWDHSGEYISIPQIKATIENVDIRKQSVCLSEGGDYRSGRRERWRVQLTDEKGRRVPDSNFGLFGDSGGLGSSVLLKHGTKGNWTNLLDARCYLRPPRPGKYHLQVFHSHQHIAREPDLTGLIVLESKPVAVIVEWPGGEARDYSLIPPIVVLSAAVAVSLGLILRRLWTARIQVSRVTSRVRWRDVAWLTLVAILAVAWLVDSRYQTCEIQRLTPDAEANWTMRLAE